MEKNCFGCKTVIPGKEYMKCEGCKHKYDLPCAELSPKRFKKLSLDYKRNWKCPECKCKLPKRDNSNTPVRTLTETQQPQEDDETDTEPPSVAPRTDPGVSTRRLKACSPQPQYVTEDALRDIWRNEMKQEMETIIETTIKRTVSNHLKSINSQCSGFQESIAYVSTQYEDLRKEITDLKKLLNNTTSELGKIREENKNLKDNLGACLARVRILEEESLRQQQWVRMQNIEVTGIPEKNGENPIEILLKTTQCIGVTIQQADIEFAHRVQPRHAASAARARPIVVRLRQRSVKDQIVAAARKRRNLTAGEMGMGGETDRVFINEHLTKDNKMLLNACKLKAKESNYKFIWTKNCRVFVRKNESSPPIPINSMADLVKIV